MREAGVAACPFNPLSRLDDLAHRDHRKILTVDRETGFTGGINLSAAYSSGSFGRSRHGAAAAQGDKEGWRDTQIRSAARPSRRWTTWCARPGRSSTARVRWRRRPGRPAPAGPGRGRTTDAHRALRTDDTVNRIYALMMSSIGAARQSIRLTMAYFAPGDDMVQALCDAARRGVDVQLILPSRSDFAPVLQAGRSYYTQLLEAGVKIHELQDSVLHAKTAVIDGVVSSVGSSNLDRRSFTGNNEINAVVIGEDFGAAMGRMFAQDLQASVEITRQAWASRSLWAARQGVLRAHLRAPLVRRRGRAAATTSAWPAVLQAKFSSADPCRKAPFLHFNHARKQGQETVPGSRQDITRSTSRTRS